MGIILKKIIGFFLIFSVSLVVINPIIARYGDTYNEVKIKKIKRDIVAKKLHYFPGKINVVFVGSSYVLNGLRPDIFDKEFEGKTHTLNFGEPLQDVGGSLFQLRRHFLNNKPPEYMVLLIQKNDFNDIRYAKGAAAVGFNIGEASSYILHQRRNYLWELVFPMHTYYESIKKYTWNSIFNPADILYMKKRDQNIANELLSSRGFLGIDRVRSHRLTYEKCKPNLSTWDYKLEPYIDEFLCFAKEHGIKVLLIQGYQLPESYLQYQNIPHYVAQIVRHHKNVRVAKNGWKIKYYASGEFCDDYHLNILGATKYTKEIAAEFKEVFGAEIHSPLRQ